MKPRQWFSHIASLCPHLAARPLRSHLNRPNACPPAGASCSSTTTITQTKRSVDRAGPAGRRGRRRAAAVISRKVSPTPPALPCRAAPPSHFDDDSAAPSPLPLSLFIQSDALCLWPMSRAFVSAPTPRDRLMASVSRPTGRRPARPGSRHRSPAGLAGGQYSHNFHGW